MTDTTGRVDDRAVRCGDVIDFRRRAGRHADVALNAPLLFVSNEFDKTDVRAALAAGE